MKNRQSGFTLFELIVVMAIFTLVIAGASNMFVSLLGEFKQQSKIAATNIEGILGLEMMRRDIEHAGYGLAWDGMMNYSELATPPDAYAAANGSFNDAPLNPPRALVSGDGTGWNATDRLVVKAVNVAMNTACEHWTFLYTSPAVTTYSWTPPTDNLSPTDRVIAISQDATTRTLVPHTGGGFSNTFSNVAGFSTSRSDPSIVYAVDPNTPLKMPFNRADFYVQAPPSGLPRYCASGTGILYKAVISQGGQGFLSPQPLLECVADMQVVYLYDAGGVLTKSEDIHTLTASDVRSQVKEVRVYILAQEGQMDRSYVHPNQVVQVGETGGAIGTVGRPFDFQDPSHPIPDWKNYRWKLYTMVVRPSNLQ